MGAPVYTCLVYLIYVCFIFNHTHSDGINGKPTTNATGSTDGISPLFRFRFWQPVYYKVDESDFPSDSTKNVVAGLVSPNMLDML